MLRRWVRGGLLVFAVSVSLLLTSAGASAAPYCPGCTVGYWRLEGSSESIAEDCINANNGTLLTDGSGPEASWVPSGMVGGAVHFAGDANDRVVIPHDSAYNWGTGAFAIEAWIKYEGGSAVTFPAILAKRPGPAGSNPDAGFQLSLSYWSGASLGSPMLSIAGTNYVSASGTPVDNGLWHHIVAQRCPSGEVQIYVDGQMDSTFNSSKNASSSGDVTIGVDPSSNISSQWQGLIDEVALYGCCLTASEVLQHFEAGLHGQHYLADCPCECSANPHLLVIDCSGAEILVPVSGTVYAEPLELELMLMGCDPPAPECWITGNWTADALVHSQQTFTSITLGGGQIDSEGYLGVALMETGCTTINTSYTCACDRCPPDAHWFRICPCLCGGWFELVVECDGVERPVFVGGQPQYPQYDYYAELPAFPSNLSGPVTIKGEYHCAMCDTALALPDHVNYEWYSDYTPGSTHGASVPGDPFELQIPPFDDDADNLRDGFVIELQPLCEGLSCPEYRIWVRFTP